MANTYFRFKEFVVHQDQCAMKVSTDGCLFGGWVSSAIRAAFPVTVSGGSGVSGTRVSGQRVSSSPGNAGADFPGPRVLDIGAGTGLLSLMIAQQNPSADITGVELQASSAEQGASNMAISPWGAHLHMITGNINTQVFSQPFDVIVSNPPFFEGDLRGEQADRNLARHGDSLSLAQLISVIHRNLTIGGMAALLLPFHRIDAALELGVAVGLYCREKVLVRQTPGHGYFRGMLLLRRGVGECREAEVVIKSGEEYTGEFVGLLKDYYLYL